MKTEGIALKVLVGMIVGIGVGLLLMFTVPTPIQPHDQLQIRFADGRVAHVQVAESAEAEVGFTLKEAPTPTLPLEGGGSMNPVGTRFDDAPRLFSEAFGAQVESVELTGRRDVVIRPALTEIVYVIGQVFVRLLRMIVIPLIIATVLVGIGSLGNLGKLGRLGAQTFGFYFATMGIAAVIGMSFVNLIRPGDGLGAMMPEAGTAAVGAAPTIPELILRIIPNNPIEAMATFDVLGMLFFTILIALAILSVGKRRSAPVFNFFEGLSDLMFVLIGWVMRLAPFGVAGLIAYYIGVQNPEFLGQMVTSLGLFAVTVTSGLTLHFLVLMTLLFFVGKYNPLVFLKKLTPAILTAFGTNSSNATMPMTMTSVRSMGVSKRIAGFVVPVGATMNMDGTALFEVVAVMFFAQAYLVDLTLTQQIIVALTAILAAVGAAGIPSAGLVTMALVLTAVGLPLAGIGLLLAIDRPLDMMRTVVNITGDATTSVVVQNWNQDISAEEDDLATEYEPVEPEAAHGL